MGQDASKGFAMERAVLFCGHCQSEISVRGRVCGPMSAFLSSMTTLAARGRTILLRSGRGGLGRTGVAARRPARH
eukprot:11179902-Lingulodinium_polyedra.AAC.1